MNQVGFMGQANQFLGNNIMNPRQQQQKWMDKPAGDPSGLAYLRPLDFLLAKQVVSMTECIHLKESFEGYSLLVFTGMSAQAKYGVFNDRGEQLYYAFEGK